MRQPTGETGFAAPHLIAGLIEPQFGHFIGGTNFMPTVIEVVRWRWNHGFRAGFTVRCHTRLSESQLFKCYSLLKIATVTGIGDSLATS